MGGLLKLCHLAEFTLAVEPVIAIMIFITKWLSESAGPLASFGTIASFGSDRTKMQLKTRQIVVTLNLDCSRRVSVQNSLEIRFSHTQLSIVNCMPTIRLAHLHSCRPSTHER